LDNLTCIVGKNQSGANCFSDKVADICKENVVLPHLRVPVAGSA
jgi:hypothetical protein